MKVIEIGKESRTIGTIQFTVSTARRFAYQFCCVCCCFCFATWWCRVESVGVTSSRLSAALSCVYVQPADIRRGKRRNTSIEVSYRRNKCLPINANAAGLRRLLVMVSHIHSAYSTVNRTIDERNSIAFVLDLIALALCLPGNEIYACGFGRYCSLSLSLSLIDCFGIFFFFSTFVASRRVFHSSFESVTI